MQQQGQPVVIQPQVQANTDLQTQQMMLNQQLMMNTMQQNSQKSNLPTMVAGSTLPVHVFCNSCKTESITRVEENSCTVQSCLWFWCCFYFLTIICLIPGCCPTQHTFTHYCQNCGFMLGQKPAQCT